MKTILYMVTSLDGRISYDKDDTSWVDEKTFELLASLMVECGVMLMGSETYRSFGDDLPNDKALQVVFTRNPELLATKIDNVRFTDRNPRDVLRDLELEGFTQVMFAGGENLNTTLFDEDLVDEIRLIVKPLVLGNGKLLSGELSKIKEFELISVEKLENGAMEMRLERKIPHS